MSSPQNDSRKLTVVKAIRAPIELRDAEGLLIAVVLTEHRDPTDALATAHQMAAAPLLAPEHAAMLAILSDLSLLDPDAMPCECWMAALCDGCQARDLMSRAGDLIGPILRRQSPVDAARAPERSEVDDGD